MNSTYRSIWNESLGAWVAVSEISRTGGKKTSAGATLATALLVLGAFGAASTSWAANECGAEAAGADTVTCSAAAAYPNGIAYGGSDGLTLNLNNPGITVGPVFGRGVLLQSSGTNTNAVAIHVLNAGTITATGATQHGVVVRMGTRRPPTRALSRRRADSPTGVSMGYGRSTTDFGDRRRGDAGMGYDTGKMKGQMATLGAYHTRYADNGSYLDLVGQLHAVHNKYTDKYGGEGAQKGAGFGLSAEVGRPWQIGESQWLIEPQAQLSYQATRYKGFSDDVSSVDGFTGQSLRARLGGRLAWNDKAERADKLTRTNTFYVTANLLHEFMDPKTVTIGGTSVSEDWAKKTWAELGVGAQLPLTKSTYLYGGLQYQRSLSDRSREGVSGQVGVRVAW